MGFELKGYTRREIMRLMGASAPFLFPLFSGLRAEAATELTKKAFFLHWSNGYTDAWRPRTYGANFQGGYVLEPLMKYKSSLNVFEKISTESSVGDISHNATTMLTAYPGGKDSNAKGISLDEYLGPKQGTPIQNLKLNIDGSKNDSHRITMSWVNGGKPANMIKSPAEAYRYSFQNFKFVDDNNNTPLVSNPTLLLENKKSIVDLIKKDFDSFKKNLSGAEKQKINSHFDLLRTLETKISRDIAEVKDASPRSGFCKSPSKPGTGLGYDNDKEGYKVDVRSKLFIDIAIAAMACGRTNITSLMMSEAVSSLRHGHLNGKAGINKYHAEGVSHHNISHYKRADRDSEKVLRLGLQVSDLKRMKTEIDLWHHKQMAYVVSQLIEFGMYENSVVLMGNDMGEDDHRNENSCFVMAGNLGGYLKTNQAFNFKGQKVNHSAILAAILGGFGEKGKQFGDPRSRQNALASIIA